MPVSSDVPAWLGLKAGALAWPKVALASNIFRPSCGPKPGLGLAQSGLLTNKII